MSNAFKYKKENILPEITIESKAVSKNELSGHKELTIESYHKISFRDNGIGFEQGYEHKIFELFAQLNPDKENPGTGIGLTICKKVVQNHNGFIKAESKPGEGTTFYIYLPA